MIMFGGGNSVKRLTVCFLYSVSPVRYYNSAIRLMKGAHSVWKMNTQ